MGDVHVLKKETLSLQGGNFLPLLPEAAHFPLQAEQCPELMEVSCLIR